METEKDVDNYMSNAFEDDPLVNPYIEEDYEDGRNVKEQTRMLHAQVRKRNKVRKLSYANCINQCKTVLIVVNTCR